MLSTLKNVVAVSNKEISLKMRSLTNPKSTNKHLYTLISFLIVIIFTVVLYLVPDYYFLEKVTNDVVFKILQIYKYSVVEDGLYSDFDTSSSFLVVFSNFLSSLDAHNGLTPVIKSNAAARRFAIVRACTGMQAGALLMSLIIVTPADLWKKVKATFFVLIALIVGNFFRIALVIGMTITLQVTYGTSSHAAWMWSHDVLGKPIGFFGTIFFALIIENQGVPILNTVSIWIDSLIDLFDSIFKKKKNKTKKNS